MRYRNIIGLVLVLLIAAQARVYAYTDPGSGTLIWQMIVASSLGLLFYVRRIVTWARGLKGRSKADTSDASDNLDSE